MSQLKGIFQKEVISTSSEFEFVLIFYLLLMTAVFMTCSLVVNLPEESTYVHRINYQSHWMEMVLNYVYGLLQYQQFVTWRSNFSK